VDLPACSHPVIIEYAPDRLRCKRCGARAVELLAWADGHQRQTRRLQHHLALDAFSMPLVHVSTKWGLSWHTVRRAELCAIERWERTTPQPALTMVGVDEKWLGRRHKRKEKFVTIVSDLATGVPVWMGYEALELESCPQATRPCTTTSPRHSRKPSNPYATRRCIVAPVWPTPRNRARLRLDSSTPPRRWGSRRRSRPVVSTGNNPARKCGADR
jgi:hypothetical protein